MPWFGIGPANLLELTLKYCRFVNSEIGERSCQGVFACFEIQEQAKFPTEEGNEELNMLWYSKACH
jgi:hypothetical protein